MNVSGVPVRDAIKHFKVNHVLYGQVEIDNIIVIQDHLDSKLGIVKFKFGGSANGHNGIKSITNCIQTDKYNRILIGISRPDSNEKETVAKFVLSKFDRQE